MTSLPYINFHLYGLFPFIFFLLRLTIFPQLNLFPAEINTYSLIICWASHLKLLQFSEEISCLEMHAFISLFADEVTKRFHSACWITRGSSRCMGREGFVLTHHTKLKRNEKKYLSQQTMIAKCLKEVKKPKKTKKQQQQTEQTPSFFSS